MQCEPITYTTLSFTESCLDNLSSSLNLIKNLIVLILIDNGGVIIGGGVGGLC